MIATTRNFIDNRLKRNRVIKELKRIFERYKNKYNLKTSLLLEKKRRCSFHSKENYISYDMDWLKKRAIRGFERLESLEKLIFCLLHEIKHSIDWKCNRRVMEKELEDRDIHLYQKDGNYTINLSFEQRANKFAKEELRDWI